MGWFDEQGITDYVPYEEGGVAGPVAGGPIQGPGVQDASAPPQSNAGAPASYNAGNLFGTVDQEKLKSKDDPKYNVLRILSNFPSTPEGLQQGIAAVRERYPDARISGKDSIEGIPGLGRIDVGAQFSAGGGKGWAWNPRTDAQGNPLAQNGFDLAGNNLWGPGSPYSPAQQAAFESGKQWSGETPQGARGGPGGVMGPGGGFDGGGNAFAMPGGGGGGRPSYGGPDFAGPEAYTPRDITGPQAFTPEQIEAAQAQAGAPVSAQQVNPAAAVTAQSVQPAAAVQAQQVTAPAAIRADQVQGPAAISAERIGGANAFTGPTEAELKADPSYQFRLKESLGALQNSAAAKGALRSFNTLDSLTARAGEMASQEYGNVYARKSDEYKTQLADRMNVGQANNANAFTAYDLSNRFDQNARLSNQGANLQAATTNAGLEHGTSLANMQARLQSDTFNAGQQNSVNVGNADRAASVGTFNAGQQNQIGLANAGNRLASDTFNSGQQTQTGQFNAAQTNTARGQNAANSLAAWQAYQGLNQNAQQFNAARTDTAAQQGFANSLAGWQANTNAKLGFGNLDLGYTQAGNAFSLGMGNLALGNRQADQSYDLGLRNNALGYTQAGNAFSLGQGNLGLGWAQYGLGADQQDFSQRYALANMGLNATGQYTNAAAGYGANAGNNAIGAGNAAAAGRVGSANAWTQGFTGAANGATDMYGLWLKNQRPQQGGGLMLDPGN